MVKQNNQVVLHNTTISKLYKQIHRLAITTMKKYHHQVTGVNTGKLYKITLTLFFVFFVWEINH